MKNQSTQMSPTKVVGIRGRTWIIIIMIIIIKKGKCIDNRNKETGSERKEREATFLGVSKGMFRKL